MAWNKKTDAKETPIELMTYDQLIYMRERIDQEISGRGTAELEALKEKLFLIAKAQNVSPAELFGVSPPKKERKKRFVKPKYRNPETGEEWTGIGKPKKWIAELEQQGRSRDEFLIQ